VRFDGRDLASIAAHDVARAGLAYAMEGRRIFARQSVRANLEVGSYPLAKRRSNSGRLFERVFALFPVLERKSGQLASTLSGGERQMLAIGQALMSDPRLLILDEPSAGLAPLLIQQVFAALSQLQQEGLAVLLAEQTVDQALKLCDRGYVLNAGVVVLDGPAATLRADEGVRAAYIGSLGHGARPI
jgi:branched-chain amino acid transport system ATP-binding protein